MKTEITDEQIIAFIEGEGDSDLEKLIAADPDVKRRYMELLEVVEAIRASKEVGVPLRVESGFRAALTKEKDNSNRWPWMQIAASLALLIVGFAAGTLWKGVSPGELSELRDEIQSLREVTLTNTLQPHSASERIMAVNQIEQRGELNRALISTLISTLNSDESPNVRYAALQALKKFINDHEVRAELVKSLDSQTDPLIQISLITILVEAEERSAIAPLKDLIKNNELTPEVKQQAEVAIQVLT